jgi:phage terminase large subunit-like protein
VGPAETRLTAHAIDQYPLAVADGRIVAGKYHRLACQRHLTDRAREGSDAFPYRLSVPEVDRFVRFASRLRHYKGEWAGRFIGLEPHQVFRLGSVIGWLHRDTGLRRFRQSYNELPRKNGKSLEAALMSLYLTFFDMEPGAEGYCAATRREQASIVFNDAKRLVRSSGLRTRIEVLTHNLNRDAYAQRLQPLSADDEGMDGLNAHFVNLDELHAMKTRAMIDVLEGATGARRQPLVFKITTAGSDDISPCGDEHAYACQVLEGVLTDETYFAFIAHADKEDDWSSELAARKANPNYGISVNPGDLLNKRVKAIGMPSAAATYKQKHLNLWVSAAQPWLSLDGWRLGQSADLSLEGLRGDACVVGVDLASKLDLLAMTALFLPTEARPTWAVLRWVWTPKATLEERRHRDRAPYDLWVDQGHLIAVEGTKVNHQVVREQLVILRDAVEILAVGFDPWHADQLQIQLVQDDGFPEGDVLEVSQTFAGMSSGCKEMEAVVLAGQVDAGDCPLMEWCVSNAVVMKDNKENIYPVKRRSRGRIDPVVAMAIAWNLAVRLTVEEEAQDPDLLVV